MDRRQFPLELRRRPLGWHRPWLTSCMPRVCWPPISRCAPRDCINPAHAKAGSCNWFMSGAAKSGGYLRLQASGSAQTPRPEKVSIRAARSSCFQSVPGQKVMKKPRGTWQAARPVRQVMSAAWVPHLATCRRRHCFSSIPWLVEVQRPMAPAHVHAEFGFPSCPAFPSMGGVDQLWPRQP